MLLEKMKRKEWDGILCHKKQILSEDRPRMIAIVPIAPIAIREGKYFSASAEKHPSFGEASDKRTPLYALILYVLFRDTDKPGFDSGRPNILGGIAFDFDYSRFESKDIPPYADRLPQTIDGLATVDWGDVQASIGWVDDFKGLISGKEGMQFLDHAMKASGYSQFSPEEMQDTLSSRSDELRYILESAASHHEQKDKDV
jgi:hypothetical protein